MRIISKSRLKEFWAAFNQAKGPLKEWHVITEKAQWGSFAELKTVFSTADQVRVKSGNTITVFNIGGNKFRLVAAVHYNTKTVYVLMIMTHEEYNEDKWKDKF